MSTNSKIEWTDATWNPIRGCSRVSEGCRNCYAEKVAARFSGSGLAYEGLAAMKQVVGPDGLVHIEARWTNEIQVMVDKIRDPLRWRKPRRVFVNSMSDLFHEKVSFGTIRAIFNVMDKAKRHTFQILTKRPDRMLEWMRSAPYFLLPNVWLGVSIEDQASADKRIPLLMQMPAAVRWVSYEPALGAVDFEKVPLPDAYLRMNGITGVAQPKSEKDTEPDDYRYWTRKGFKLDWVVCGGESGPGARPMHPEWARSARDQCQVAGVPFFFKQWGEWCPCAAVDPKCHEQWPENRQVWNEAGLHSMRLGKKRSGRLLDGREWSEYPR